MLCGPDTVDSRQSRVHRTYCFPEVSVNKYFDIDTMSQKANFIQKYIKYFINFLKSVKFNSVHNVIHKTFAVSAVQRLRALVTAHVIFFCYSPVNNALPPSRADAGGNSLISSTHVTS